MIDDVGEAVGEVVGAVFQHAGGLVADVVVEGIFAGGTARFFHGVGHRAIALATLGRIRIASSLRVVPRGTRAGPRPNDWIALWIGILLWVALFAAICVPLGMMLWG